MKKLLVFSFVTALVIVLSQATNALALENPAAVYCKQLGYQYQIKQTFSGERGVCVINNVAYDEWDFFSGKVAKSYNYCAKNGYSTITKTDGKNSYSKDYAVCVSQGKEISIPVSVGAVKINNIPKATQPILQSYSYPASFDWRNVAGVNYITTVKNQGQYPTCSYFAAIANVEAQRNIDTNTSDPNFDLSEQDLESCHIGGYDAYDMFVNPGVVDENCFPYNGSYIDCSNKCSGWQTRTTKIYSYNQPTFVRSDEEAKWYIANNGPIDSAISMSGSFDANGIWRCGGTFDHAVLIVGYNEAGQYWIVKNSWGNNWNGDGYFKVEYNDACILPVYHVQYSECKSGETKSCDKQLGVCAGSVATCDSNKWGSCNYTAIPGYQDNETLCDGKDNDCDGLVDEGCPVCSADSDCGTSGLTGNNFCKTDDLKNVFHNFVQFTCHNAGTSNAYCDSSKTAVLNQACVFGNICANNTTTGASCQGYTTCVDGDGGINSNTKGVVIIPKINSKTSLITKETIYTDSCDKKGAKLTEYFCSSKGKVSKGTIKCSCSNGACISGQGASDIMDVSVEDDI